MLASLTLASAAWSAARNGLMYVPPSLRNSSLPLADIGPSLMVRGTTIDVPFQLRIQLEDLSSFAPQATRGFQISGTGLKVEGAPIGETTQLSCAIYKNPMAIFNTSPFDPFPAWLCRSPNFQKILRNTSLKISSTQGFLGFGKNVYRGSLELVSQDDHLLIINHVGLDPYLAALVNEEIDSSFPPEAIKAQIIAARSYALATAADRRREGNRFDLYGTEADQMYSGSRTEDAKAYELVRAVSGKVLVHFNNVLKAYYHSNSGGYSEVPQNVWGDKATLLDQRAFLARSSQVDSELPDSEWSAVISPKQGAAFADLGEIRKINVISRSDGKRVKSLLIDGTRTRKTISGAEFRSRLGPRFIKSTYFTVSKVPNGFLIEGRGWGHGVGLSQLGAKALAQKGLGFEEILKYYYPFASVEPLPLLDSLPRSAPPKKSLLPVQAR